MCRQQMYMTSLHACMRTYELVSMSNIHAVQYRAHIHCIQTWRQREEERCKAATSAVRFTSHCSRHSKDDSIILIKQKTPSSTGRRELSCPNHKSNFCHSLSCYFSHFYHFSIHNYTSTVLLEITRLFTRCIVTFWFIAYCQYCSAEIQT